MATMEISSQILQDLKSYNPTESTLTSNQIFTLLDVCIKNCTDALFSTTYMVESGLASTISWYDKNKKRKLTPHTRADYIYRVMGIISTTDVNVKKKELQLLQVERSVSFSIIESFLRETKQYINLMARLDKDSRREVSINNRKTLIESKVYCKSDNSLYCTIIKVKAWYNIAMELRGLIVRKYSRYVFTKVKMDSETSVGVVDEGDMAINYMLALIQALHKYSTSKGTFKPYLDWWLKDAKTSRTYKHYYGLAYEVPNMDVFSKEGVNNISADLESKEALSVKSECIDEQIVNTSEEDRIRKLAEYADPLGFARSAMRLN